MDNYGKALEDYKRVLDDLILSLQSSAHLSEDEAARFLNVNSQTFHELSNQHIKNELNRAIRHESDDSSN